MKSKRTIIERLMLVPALLLAVCGVAFMADSAAAETVKIPHTPEMYKETPEALTPAQCGQCHAGHFKGLQEDGKKHQFACQNCHTRFHAYNPTKANYADLMPKCGTCHLTLPHGDKFTDCLSCHANPHTPRKVAFNENLVAQCGQCHTSPAGQLAQFPSKHTQQGCTTCHTKHGLIPSCFECHQPHVEGQTFEDCKSCHHVHRPLQIQFAGENTKINTCKACHDAVYDKWSKTESKHGKVSCAKCHVEHGKIPQCTTCHNYPHGQALHKQIPRCLDCHLDVHDLPVRPGKKK